MRIIKFLNLALIALRGGGGGWGLYAFVNYAVKYMLDIETEGSTTFRNVRPGL